jgi:predicted DCC family thiol-disulfide oxidoreductase YuxK
VSERIESSTRGAPRLQVFFDGACPLCSREKEALARRDRGGQIEFIDIAEPEFDAAAWGREPAEFMAAMHVRLPDGRWVLGADAFRQLYGLLGFGWLVALTRVPGIRQAVDAGYRAFARNRTRLTGRCSVEGGCSALHGDGDAG